MNLDEIVFHLLKTTPFYGHMLRQCRIKMDNNFMAPAGVIVKGNIEMVINPSKMEQFPLEVQAGVVEHELKHLFHDHISDYHRIGSSEAELVQKKKSHMAFNIAADCQINPTIKSLVEDPARGKEAVAKMKALKEQFKDDEEGFNKSIKELASEWTFVFPNNYDMDDGHHWTTYYKALLMKYQNDDGTQMMIDLGDMSGDIQGNGQGDGDEQKEGKGNGQGDDNEDKGDQGHSHSYFEESLSDQEVLDEIVSKAAKAAKNSNFGKAPQMVEEYFIEVENRKKLPWHVILKRFIANQISIHKRSSWNKVNRRFPELIPGKKRIPKLKILIGADASGSIADKEWSAFFNEINAIHAEDAEIWVAEFDTEIANYYKYTGTPEKRKTSGGTCFIPVHKKAIEERFKAVIYFTDGWGSFPNKNEVTYKTLWVLDSGMNPSDVPYGDAIKMELNDDK